MIEQDEIITEQSAELDQLHETVEEQMRKIIELKKENAFYHKQSVEKDSKMTHLKDIVNKQIDNEGGQNLNLLSY